MPSNLQRAHSLFRFQHEANRHHPFFERQVGIVKDRPGRHGELVAAVLALVQAARGNLHGHYLALRLAVPLAGGFVGRKLCDAALAGHATLNAAETIRPAQLLQVIKADILSCEFAGYVYQAHG